MPEISLEQSSWFIPLCLLLSAGISYLVYSKKSPWSKATNRTLAGFRFVLIFILLVLLLNPLLNQKVVEVEKPVVLFGVDHSLSMTNGLSDEELSEFKSSIKKQAKVLEEKGLDVVVKTLDGASSTIDSIRFEAKTTDLDAWLRAQEMAYEGQNLSEVYLFSDGKYNQGMSPAFFPYNFKVSTVGLGDTIQKEDVVLQQVLFNKLAYQGNEFPVVVDVVNHGYQDESTDVEIWKGSKRLAYKKMTFTKEHDLQRVELAVDASKQGMQQLLVKVKPLVGEAVTVNNQKNIFVDVIDGKQKILLLAPAPHPDIKALSAVLENNKNFELTVHIPRLNELVQDKYDLVIVHQAYDKYKRTQKVVDAMKKTGVPLFYILGNQSNIVLASRGEEGFHVRQQGTKRDAVFGVLNDGYKDFTLANNLKEVMNNYPPLSVPYGQIQLPANAKVLLYQRIGSIGTTRPLLYTHTVGETKSAYLLSEGIWKWRMQEYAIADETPVFDELFLKLIQVLSTKVDKRKFRCYPSKVDYYEHQAVAFRAELYNDIFERIYGLPIQLEVSNEEGEKKEFSFVPSSAYSKLDAGNFKPGIYTYTATTTLAGKKQRSSGKFSVKELQLEKLDQVADFGLLRQVAENSGGQFYPGLDSESLRQAFVSADAKGVVHAQEDIFPLLHLKWLFFVFLMLVSIEWLVRKYSGGY